MPQKNLSLAEIRTAVPEIAWHNYADTVITNIQHDSRKVTSGSLWIGTEEKTDAKEQHLQDALQRGAAAVIVAALPLCSAALPVGVSACPSQVLSRLSALVWGAPARRLTIAGITGTNGKTTTSYLLHSFLQAAGHPTGLLGTTGYFYGRHSFAAPNTTPEALVLHEHFARMVENGITHVSMEVSSHSLSLKRVADIEFRAAVFTNLGRDHLDYHQNMEQYREAKAILFRSLAKDAHALLNQDDPASKYFQEHCQGICHSFGLSEQAEFHVRHLRFEGMHSYFTLVTPQGQLEAVLPLPGAYNVYNALAAAACALTLGVSLPQIVESMRKFSGVPGRMEQITCGQPFIVLVDYAHTPEAMQACLGTLAQVKKRRLLVVFGCGGDRDPGKRPQMGKIASQCADYTWVTSDNPRTEQPEKITGQIVAGFATSQYQVIVNREQAILSALQAAQPDDIVVIIGKGHETGQIIGKQTFPFDDRDVARACLEKLGFHR